MCFSLLSNPIKYEIAQMDTAETTIKRIIHLKESPKCGNNRYDKNTEDEPTTTILTKTVLK